jgi:outer membrane protein OmpA-like peptidoglycan-associated protein
MVRRLPLFTLAMFVTACGGASSTAAPAAVGSESAAEESAPPEPSEGEPPREGEFQLQSSDTAGQARGERPSQIQPTATHAAMRLFVVDPDAGPIPGIVIKMTAPNGTPYYTEPTDSTGYAEVLVPAGQRYEMEYLSLGRRNTTASVTVRSGPNQNVRLTMRHRRQRPEPSEGPADRVVLDGVLFGTASARIDPESYPRLDRVVEYMTHRPSTRIRVAGHTDNAGNPRRNQQLSEARARAVRDYLVSHGIDESRVEAVGYGDQQPVASNDTPEGQAQNRRIEAIEL